MDTNTGDGSREPLSVGSCLKVGREPVFVRSVRKPADWLRALSTADANAAKRVFHSPDHRVSLWYVSNDTELRRAAMAINEHRSPPTGKLDLLAVLPQELIDVGIACEQTSLGVTECPEAAALHHDALMDEGKSRDLCKSLMSSRRALGRCTRSQIRTAIQLSEQEGCFAVSGTSTACDCGATRDVQVS